jgi:hypothetical protein
VYGMLFNVYSEFIGRTNTINIRLILLTIYIFIPVSGCVGRVPVQQLIQTYQQYGEGSRPAL